MAISTIFNQKPDGTIGCGGFQTGEIALTRKKSGMEANEHMARLRTKPCNLGVNCFEL